MSSRKRSVEGASLKWKRCQWCVRRFPNLPYMWPPGRLRYCQSWSDIHKAHRSQSALSQKPCSRPLGRRAWSVQDRPTCAPEGDREHRRMRCHSRNNLPPRHEDRRGPIWNRLTSPGQKPRYWPCWQVVAPCPDAMSAPAGCKYQPRHCSKGSQNPPVRSHRMPEDDKIRYNICHPEENQ